MRNSGLINATVLALTLITWLLPSSARANVSMKNGDFFILYTDILYHGGIDPKIERVYNSKTSFSGMFGEGWGNELEAYLSVEADGSVRVHEYGGGADNIFAPVAFSEAELGRAVAVIVEAAQKTGAFASASALEQYRKHLKADLEFRNKEWDRFRSQGKVAVRDLPIGTQLRSNKFNFQVITKTPQGYTRSFDTGKIQFFDANGRLLKIADKNHNFIELGYGRDGHLSRIVDNFGRKMFFTFNSEGLVTTIEAEGGKKADYQYNRAHELVYSRDADGNVYRFKYDSNGRHNMVQIEYSDKTTLAVSYYPITQHENVHLVKNRDGTVTEYSYPEDHTDRGHLIAVVAVRDSDGKAVSSSRYEYFNRFKATGEEWLYKLVENVDGDVTETIYNECCGLPLIIKHGGEETTFEYDPKGHVTKKITPTDVTVLTYDAKVSKVSKVMRYSKLESKSVSWSTFKYDERGNLIFAKNSQGKAAQLFYDSAGRIRSIMDQARRRIDFRYNEDSKPIEITDPSLGTITVAYNNNGEIKNVQSTAGRRIASQVTSAFQNLLEIIRPAGVTFSF